VLPVRCREVLPPVWCLLAVLWRWGRGEDDELVLDPSPLSVDARLTSVSHLPRSCFSIEECSSTLDCHLA
jgi:hypothetical protein